MLSFNFYINLYLLKCGPMNRRAVVVTWGKTKMYCISHQIFTSYLFYIQRSYDYLTF